jgi:hypothetical protein
MKSGTGFQPVAVVIDSVGWYSNQKNKSEVIFHQVELTRFASADSTGVRLD